MALINQFENLNPLRSAPGEIPVPVLFRNMFFDQVFYDTSRLKQQEMLNLLGRTFAFEEGAMLVVHPSEADQETEYFSLSADLVKAYPDISAVAIPGVGSSPIGAAAIARQVADTINKPVVGIIAGYGAADIMSEALGGWFDFGMKNRAQAAVDFWRSVIPAPKEDEAQLKARYDVPSTTYLIDEPESNTLLNLMLRLGGQLDLVVGHSKGALNIMNAASAFVRETNLKPEHYSHIQFVTFGCGITLPHEVSHLTQFCGTWDVLGLMNTPSTVRTHGHIHWVDCKGHNLVSANPFCMPFVEMLGGCMTDAAAAGMAALADATEKPARIPEVNTQPD